LKNDVAFFYSQEEEFMDHQAFAQLLGNYGEFFGAIAVVATLLYLARQIRQNTKATRVAARSHIVEATMAIRGRYIDNGILRAAMLKERRGEKLNEEESFLIYQNTAMALRNWEHQHYLYTNGALNDDAYRTYQAVWRAGITPYTKKIWPALRDQFTTEFAQVLDPFMESEAQNV
jgi:hypothetical protein